MAATLEGKDTMHANPRRAPRIVPLAVLLALAAGACGTPWAKGTNATSTSSTSTSSAATSSTATSSTAANNAAADNPAPTGAGPPAADALSPSAQAEYCKRTSPLDIALPSEDGVRQSSNDLKTQSQIFAELSTYSPSGLHGDVALLATDYQALADGSRTLPQVDGEVHTSFRRVMDYRNLICLTEEERRKQSGN
jgi:hypothetical protein